MAPADEPSVDLREAAEGRLAAVRHRIDEAARGAGRDPGAVRLVAVSKTFAAEAIQPVLVAGQRIFGENRVQEAEAKWPGLKQRWSDVELHLIGPLQTNKARDAVALFDVIHTVDRPRLADALAKEIARLGRRPRLLIEVNTGAEPQKAGVSVEGLPALLEHCRVRAGLEISGLMCIPPHDEDPVPHFQRLATLARAQGLAELSMGMSADFEAAVRCGATYVRVGSAIFGARH